MGALQRLHVAAFAGLALVGLAFLFADRNTLIVMGREDGFAENLTAIIYFIAAMLCFWTAFGRHGDNVFLGRKTRWNLWLLLLGFFFLFCAGEEVSWGQRIFGWQTPSGWAEINDHRETNLHNLLGSDSFGVTPDRLFTAIWVMYCVALPLLTRMSAKMQAIVAWFGVPVPPLSVGLLFLLVWFVFRIIMLPYADLAGDETKAIREWKEAGYAAAYLVLALGFLITRQRRDPAGQLSSARADP